MHPEVNAIKGTLTGSDAALLAQVLDGVRATGNAPLVQFAGVQGALASTERALGMGSHGVASVDLTLHVVRIMLLAWVSDGGSCQACSSHGEEFAKLDHD
jgi:hypothetical protein